MQEKNLVTDSGERPKKRKLQIVGILCGVLVLGAAAAGGYYEYTRVYESVIVEAGIPVYASDFLKDTDEKAYFTAESDVADFTLPGTYALYVKRGILTYPVTLTVRDTIAPTAETTSVYLQYGETCEAADFVEEILDATLVEVSYAEEPDFTQTGPREVMLALEDAGGNRTTVTAGLEISPVVESVEIDLGESVPAASAFAAGGDTVSYETDVDAIDTSLPGDIPVKLLVEGRTYDSLLCIVDNEPPVIEGTADLTVIQGGSVIYKKDVTVTDNCAEGLTLTVDTTGVDLNTVGDYDVTYIATDLSGNVTEVTVTLTVEESSYSLEEVDALADAVLEKILTDDMTLEEKAWAIFTYVKSNVGYISHSEKGDWVRAAYEGLKLRQGDCYVYASMSKELLTRAGIPNMDIKKIPTRSDHYWNLVDVGDGWLHFDTTPRSPDHPTIFLWTEEELMAYSALHHGSHNYDHDLYPEVN